jgi:predicted transcriptional regulator
MEPPAKNPCELIIWYVLPDLRGELAKILIKDYSLKQKDVATIFGVTPAAINQYLSSKRGGALIKIVDNHTKKAKNVFYKELKVAADNIYKENTTVEFELCKLCHLIKDTRILDEIYKKYEGGSIPSVLIQYHKQSVKSTPGAAGKCIKCNLQLQNNWIACPDCGKRI